MPSEINAQLDALLLNNAEIVSKLTLAPSMEVAEKIIGSAASDQGLEYSQDDIRNWLAESSKEIEKLSANELETITAGFGGVALFTAASGTPPNKPRGGR